MTTKIKYINIINEKKKKMMKHPIVIFTTIVLLTVLSHWTLVQVYSIYCAPTGWTGPFKTFLTLGSPMCHFVNFLQFELAKHYITIWIGAAAASATWIATKVL